MYNALLFMSLVGQNYFGYNSEYENLDEEEKANMDYFNECLQETDGKFQGACTNLMLLVLEILSKMDTEDEMSDVEVMAKKNEILHDFNESDKQRLDTFLYSCIQCVGIYSEERVEERKQRKEMKLYGKDK